VISPLCPLGGSMVKEGWSALAAWRDVRMGEDGDLWHRAILDPSLLAVVGKVRGLHVLDLGCGNGYLTRRWASEGAAESLGVDATEANLRIARRRETRRRSGARFLRQDAAHLTSLESGRFDLVVAHMSLMDIRDAKNTILEVGRVLRPSGRFVFSISHPCFDVDLRSKWVVERVPYRATVYRSVAGYREEHPVRIPWKISESEVAYTRSYHRPLPTYVGYLRSAGMVVTRLEEPMPQAEAIRKSEQGPFMLEIPLHLVAEAMRVPVSPEALGRLTRRGLRSSVRTRAAGDRRSGSRGRTRGTGSVRRGSRPGS
jgi:SAM-dependent methyltransferase